jgi:DNA-binding NtrC family response regulator
LKALVQNVKLEAERNAIAAALERTGWNRKAAARLLKVSYRTLLYKIEQYQMRAPDPSLIQGGPGIRTNGNGFGGNGHLR